MERRTPGSARRGLSLALVALGSLLGCGGGGGGGGRTHALAGTWTGLRIAPPSRLGLTLDGTGRVTQSLVDGAPSTTLLGGQADDGPDLYTLTIDQETLGPLPCPFQPDAALQHATSVIPIGGSLAYAAALERDAGPSPLDVNDDLVGSRLGQGLAYDLEDLSFFGIARP